MGHPFWSFSVLVVFRFGRLPFWSSSILVVFHFGRLPFWSSFISVVFHFGRLPFWLSSILQLSTTPHLFTFYNYVFNGNSQSTPYRMISNTSNIVAGTTISVEQLSPSQILNPQENSL